MGLREKAILRKSLFTAEENTIWLLITYFILTCQWKISHFRLRPGKKDESQRENVVNISIKLIIPPSIIGHVTSNGNLGKLT